jgi:hypothetical protein
MWTKASLPNVLLDWDVPEVKQVLAKSFALLMRRGIPTSQLLDLDCKS